MNEQTRTNIRTAIAAQAVCRVLVDAFEAGGESVDQSALEDCYRAAKCVVDESPSKASRVTHGSDMYVKLTIRRNGDLELDGTGLLRRDAAQFRSFPEQAAQRSLGEILEYHTYNGWAWVEKNRGKRGGHPWYFCKNRTSGRRLPKDVGAHDDVRETACANCLKMRTASETSSIFRHLATGQMYQLSNHQAPNVVDSLLSRGRAIWQCEESVRRIAGRDAATLGIPARTEQEKGDDR